MKPGNECRERQKSRAYAEVAYFVICLYIFNQHFENGYELVSVRIGATEKIKNNSPGLKTLTNSRYRHSPLLLLDEEFYMQL